MNAKRPVGEGYFLVGPTAAGKSAVAQWIAENHGYDILSADSMVVYRGMDIGTAKPGADEQSRVRYHGLDLTPPDRAFSVWDYRQHALAVFADGATRGRPMLVVGGSGLYVKSLTDGLSPLPCADPEQRKIWTDMAETGGVEALQTALREKDAALYESLTDQQNPRRLIRALERAAGPALRPAGWKQNPGRSTLVGLTMATPELKLKVESRVAGMYGAGLVDEVRQLLSRYPDLSATARQAIGYAEAMDLISGRCSEKEAIARTVTRTLQLAKRQRTWFRHQAKVEWIEVGSTMNIHEVAGRVLDGWRRYGPTEISG